MGNIAISAENLGKRYRIRGAEPYRLLSETIGRFFQKPGRRLKGRAGGGDRRREQFWALRGLSFDIAEGDRVGIIGRNGAGKSTLLKVLSRITLPTEGQVTLRGRVGSLLEVGTGFHPELTGRENVYLNGAILGMSRAEIVRKFDEIVAFAEVERFIDTPVKRYSSGMAVRLAFGIAAHLEPEILLVDEVLAVGDVVFQRKSIGKMEEAAAGGRTVLFVSHNMGAVRSLCETAILLENGRVAASGPTDEVVNQYLSHVLYSEEAAKRFPDRPDSPLVVRWVGLLDERGHACRQFSLNSRMFLEIEYQSRRDLRDSMMILAVSRDGTLIFQSHDTDNRPELLLHRPSGAYRTRVALPQRLLTAGIYTISVSAAIGEHGEHGHDGHPDVLSFTIDEEDEFVARKGYARSRGNLVITSLKWETEAADSRRWVVA